MNITFCVSSIPNQRIVSGMSAATGKLRPKSASGAPAASMTRQAPAAIPSGTPMTAARPNPMSTRFNVAAMLCRSARSPQQARKASNHLCGTRQDHWRDDPVLGARSPRGQPPDEHHDAPSPRPRRAGASAADGKRRSARSDGCDSAGIYLLGSRRRLRRVNFDLDSPVLRVVLRIRGVRRTVPAHADR